MNSTFADAAPTKAGPDSLKPSAPPPRLDQLVLHVQEYTRRWPEPLGYSENIHIGGTDTDRGFERILRESLERNLPAGEVSGIRDLGIGDGRSAAVVPHHELDLVVRCGPGRFVLEAKAWQGDVGKEEVILFLSKVLDFMSATNFEPLGPLFTGFVGLNGFTEAALRIMFAWGVIPFTQRREQISFRVLDALLSGLTAQCGTRGWWDRERTLSEQRAVLMPFVSREGRPVSDTFRLDSNEATVDVDGIRWAAGMFEEAREAHRQALVCYREARAALRVDRA